MPSPNEALVLVIGSLNMDLVARVPHLPAPGETLASEGFATVAGGKGANQAVAAARLGARTAMVGCVGADNYGRLLRDGLRHEGIDLRALRTHATQPTGMALIAVDRASRNHIVLVPGANDTLGSADLDAAEALLADAAVVVCQLEVPMLTVLQALQRAQAVGATTVLNPAPAQALDAALLAQVDWLVPNEVEASMLSGIAVHGVASAREAASVLLGQGCEHVLITLGAQGVLHAHADGMQHHPAPVVEAVDTTAAGDTFIGGFAAKLAAGASAAEAIRFGQAAAALSVTRRGAQTSIPTLREISAA
ncbi:ribokinase [Variovorax sp. LT1P1]|uniref:ribokinase n=1 Tax=Variovorax sp. LT1P1 TaxID=3443730 RepID=UPI003F48234C